MRRQERHPKAGQCETVGQWLHEYLQCSRPESGGVSQMRLEGMHEHTKVIFAHVSQVSQNAITTEDLDL